MTSRSAGLAPERDLIQLARNKLHGDLGHYCTSTNWIPAFRSEIQTATDAEISENALDAEETQSSKIPGFEFLPDPGQWWVQIIVVATSQTMLPTVHFHLLKRHLLVIGKPIGKLPSE
ncbi:hypothetical protein B0O99DRAFT_690160 [Bisporella sp. PMI_857]|nr:hypothetical protein B0O99DRAFT_690160 [Bisporella sp. PMI_857]